MMACLLQLCTSSGSLPGITSPFPTIESCIQQVVDEIHERDRFADFLLILVRCTLLVHYCSCWLWSASRVAAD